MNTTDIININGVPAQEAIYAAAKKNRKRKIPPTSIGRCLDFSEKSDKQLEEIKKELKELEELKEEEVVYENIYRNKKPVDYGIDQ
jgi:hypothetical protein